MTRRSADGRRSVGSDDGSTESRRLEGDAARSATVAAASSVADAVRSTLGPRGRDKLLVDDEGTVVVTNDGATILESLNIRHPTATLLADVAHAQESAVGDGTTSAVVLAGELLTAAIDLAERGVHPSTIVRGYRRAERIARDELEALSRPVDPADADLLERVAATAMTGTRTEGATDALAAVVVEAASTATRRDETDEDGTPAVDRDAIDIRPFRGGSVADSRFVDGVMVAKAPPHPEMPTSLTDARVLVYEGGLESDPSERDVKTSVADPDRRRAFAARERRMLERVVDDVARTGADVVLVGGGIDDRAQQRFADRGILALRRVREPDRRRVADATGATRLEHVRDAAPTDLGVAGRIQRERIRPLSHSGDAKPERSFVFDDLEGGAVGTIVLRGGTEHVLEEVERALEDGIDAVAAALEGGSILPGAGAPELELARAVRDEAPAVEGREQLAVEAVADALEVGPRTLAENAGRDVVDALAELTATHAEGDRTVGIDGETGEPFDATAAGVVDPYRVKASALETAVDAATMLLRIDGVVAVDDLSTSDSPSERSAER